jgi:hypothetical protein
VTDSPSEEQSLLIEKVKQLVAQSKRVQEAKRTLHLAEHRAKEAGAEYQCERLALWTLERELAELCK